MAILGSFRGGSEVAFVTSVFFALSSETYCAVASNNRIMPNVTRSEISVSVVRLLPGGLGEVGISSK